MSGPLHTVGTWEVGGWENLSVLATTPNGNVCTIVLMAGGDAYRPAYQNDQLGEWQANARLIAAAPDLLAALIDIRDAARQLAANDETHDQESWQAVADRCDAAIAKATHP